MKCSAACKYYDAYTTSNKIEIVCAIRGYTIRDIKDKFPEVYNDCEKFKSKNKQRINKK